MPAFRSPLVQVACPEYHFLPKSTPMGEVDSFFLSFFPKCMPAHQLPPPLHTCVHVVCCPGTEGVELEAAAAVPVVYGTADLALRHRAKLSKGTAQLGNHTALILWQHCQKHSAAGHPHCALARSLQSRPGEPLVPCCRRRSNAACAGSSRRGGRGGVPDRPRGRCQGKYTADLEATCCLKPQCQVGQSPGYVSSP